MATDNTTPNTSEPLEYMPSDDDRRAIKMVEESFEQMKRVRAPHEQKWFINGAMLRGQQYMEWSNVDKQLVQPPAPSYRKRLVVNRLQPKVRSRLSKFLRNRPVPVVTPATQDIDDKLKARATSKNFEYIGRKIRLEQKFADALRWAAMTGHGYWWSYWDDSAIGNVKIPDQMRGESVVEAKVGEVGIEVGSPFEVFVEDPTIHFIGDQPRIMRVKQRTVDYVKGRYPDVAKYIKAETSDAETLRYEKQLGELNATSMGGSGLQTAREGSTDGGSKRVTVLELFEKPCPSYPKGRYVVVANGILLKAQDELPYGFYDMANPYPCVDFVDWPQVGQYYITTLVEQAIPIQREYNELRSRLAEHTRLVVHPKVLVARQHQLQAGAWTSRAGELVEFVAHPAIRDPQVLVPPPISADVWRSFELMDREIAELFHIYPESDGKTGQAQSGFQTSLLQESADAVHAPDQRAHELSMIEAFYKIRRLQKAGYDIPRLVSVTGSHLTGEAFEFSQKDIDETADIIVETGSALPLGKAERTQFLVELGAGGWLGNPADPNDRARFLNYLELGSVEDAYDFDRRDEELSRLENMAAEEGRPIEPPGFYENHDLHQRLHADKLKSPGTKLWPPERKAALIHHLLEHVKWINPQAAIQLATMVGDIELAQQIIAEMGPAMGAPAAPSPAPPGAEVQQGGNPAATGPAPQAPTDQPL